MCKLFCYVAGCLLFGGGSGSAQTAWPSVDDPSKLRFLMAQCIKPMGFRAVIGVLAVGIDLSNDDVTARQILNRAARFAQEKCPHSDGFTNINADIFHGDPATLTEESYKRSGDALYGALGTARRAVHARNYRPVDIVWEEYGNWDTVYQEGKQRAEKVAQEQRAQQEAARAQAENARVQQAHKEARLEAFLKRSRALGGAGELPLRDVCGRDLEKNPFSMVGKSVIFPLLFDTMLSPNAGVFNICGGLGPRIVLSGIPTNRFTRAGAALTTVRVLGKEGGNLRFQYVYSEDCTQTGLLGECVDIVPANYYDRQ